MTCRKNQLPVVDPPNYRQSNIRQEGEYRLNTKARTETESPVVLMIDDGKTFRENIAKFQGQVAYAVVMAKDGK